MKNPSTTSGPKKITTKVIATMKKNGSRIACLTAYDYITARLLDQSGIDLILVGDSLGMVFQGQETTLPVTLDEIIYHAKTVVRGVIGQWSSLICHLCPIRQMMKKDSEMRVAS